MKKSHFIQILTLVVLGLLSNSLLAQGTAFLSGDTATGSTTWVNTGDIIGTGVLFAPSNNVDFPEGSSTGKYLNLSGTWTNNVTNDGDKDKIYPLIGFKVTYPGQIAAGWPASTTAEMADVWFQYNIAPTVDNDVHVNKIEFSLTTANGTTNMRCNAYISTDPTFATKTKISGASAVAISSPGFTNMSITGLDVVVKSNEKLYLRIYPWYQSATSSTSKYIAVKNVSFTTIAAGGSSVDITDSKLTEVAANGIRLAGYSPTQTTYSIELPVGTTQVPRLTGVKSEPTATTSITNAVSAPGTSTILVTAVDGSKTTYTVNFNLPAVVPQIAFPGAEGYGKYATGGRGGTVYEVTNLNDDGLEGSLRYAVNQSGPRTVIFKVSGTIILSSDLKISNPNITIAGQTAPGDGICLRKYSLILDGAKNVIIRYIRVRLGNESGGESDAVSGRGASNIILDHVSASWSVDEVMSIYFCNNITVQWSMIAESLFNSNHPKGDHGFGGIAGSDNSTYHHNLIAHNSSRNMRMSSGCGYFDFRNNAVYNWGYNSTYGGENQQVGEAAHAYSMINMVANYYKPGPATTPGGTTYRLANPGYRTVKTDYGKWFLSNNVMAGSSAVTADNVNGGGLQPDGGSGDIPTLKLTSPWVAMPINEQAATDAFYSILDNVGATLPKRDAVDTHVVHDARNGDATYEGPTYETKKTVPNSANKCGIIDMPDNVGGWPVLNSLPAPVDTDHDGMPDAWEQDKGLNKDNASDGNTVGADGYTNLEKYLNSIEFNYPVTDYTLVKPTETSYKLGWADNYLAETGFKVERSYNNGAFEEIADLPQYSNTYTDTSSFTGLITYRVVAYNVDNSSPRTTSISYGTLGLNDNALDNSKINSYPNPFSDEINIDLPLSEAQKIRIELFDMNGKKITTIADRVFEAGSNSIVWNIKNAAVNLNSGMYVLSIKSANSIIKKEVKLIKK